MLALAHAVCVCVSRVQAAAALAVGVGSFSDPQQLQGLAHYLEHMLFMGSEKYPDENEYDAFLNKHGGGSNAYTELVSSREPLAGRQCRVAVAGWWWQEGPRLWAATDAAIS